MKHEDYMHAAAYWDEKDAAGVKMEPGALREAIEDFIRSHNTCALATGSGDYVRVTPIEYAWRGGAFWMFTEGGHKFIGLEKNKAVALAVYEPYSGFGAVHGLQVQGTAELIEPFSAPYIEAAEFKKIPVEALKKLPEPMHLLQVLPEEMTYLNSDFRKDGYNSRQTWKKGCSDDSRK